MEEHCPNFDLVLNDNNPHTGCVEESLLFETQKIENLPTDYEFNGNETIETFFIHDDLILNIDFTNQSFIQELVAESNTPLLNETIHQLETPMVPQDDGMVFQEGEIVTPISPITEKKLTRKRKREPTKWKSHVSKVNRQSGKPYTTIKKGIRRPGRFVKEIGCSNAVTCPFNCMFKLDNDARQSIHDSYWLLNDSEKRHFYAANIKRVPCLRKRTKAELSRKSYSLQYYFNYMNCDIRVCQQFFVNTINVNKGRVYYFFGQSGTRPTITPGIHKHGRHIKKVLSEQRKQGVRDHINKFPAIESHYCRASTKKTYLDQGLNLAQMYRLYAAETDKPVKISAYRKIFDYEFNLGFFKPKKDRCDKCIEFGQLRDPKEELKIDYSIHFEKKTNAHKERNRDRDELPEIRAKNKSAVGAGDLENVFQLPIANASNLYYLRKFAVYNYTFAIHKVIYNVMWNEFCCGRAGTRLANAFVNALKQVAVDNPKLEHLTLWSDSCVPQNRNSYMSAAIQDFLDSNYSGSLREIEQKYSEAGHGEIQEVDCAHSVIENFLRNQFIYSPVSLVDKFLKIPSGKLRFHLLQMESADYFDYQSMALASKYSVIPYTKVVQLNYKKNHSQISFKLDYNGSFITNDILLKHNCDTAPLLRELEVHSTMTKAKMSDIQSMYGIMPEIDKEYYQTEFKKLIEKRPDLVTSNNEILEKSANAIDSVNTMPNTSKKAIKAGTRVTKAKKVNRPKESKICPKITTAIDCVNTIPNTSKKAIKAGNRVTKAKIANRPKESKICPKITTAIDCVNTIPNKFKKAIKAGNLVTKAKRGKRLDESQIFPKFASAIGSVDAILNTSKNAIKAGNRATKAKIENRPEESQICSKITTAIDCVNNIPNTSKKAGNRVTKAKIENRPEESQICSKITTAIDCVNNIPNTSKKAGNRVTKAKIENRPEESQICSKITTAIDCVNNIPNTSKKAGNRVTKANRGNRLEESQTCTKFTTAIDWVDNIPNTFKKAVIHCKKPPIRSKIHKNMAVR